MSDKNIVEDNLSRRLFTKRILVSALASTILPSAFSQENINFDSKNKLKFIGKIADIILPRTSSPSATDVNAHLFVLNFVEGGKEREFRLSFYYGLNIFEKEIEQYHRKVYSNVSDEELFLYMQTLLREKPSSKSYWFLYRFKQLLLVGWALNKETAESAFAYKGGIYQYSPRTDSKQIEMGNYMTKEYLDL